MIFDKLLINVKVYSFIVRLPKNDNFIIPDDGMRDAGIV